MWSHIRVTGAAARVEGEAWLGLWFTMELHDGTAAPEELHSPLIQERDLIVFRLEIQLQDFWLLFQDVLVGRVRKARLPGIPVPLILTSPANERPRYISFREYLNPMSFATDGVRSWSRGELELGSGTLNDWKEEGQPERYDRLEKAQRLFRHHYPGPIGDFVAKLGSLGDGRGDLWSARTGARIVAPLLAKIHSIHQDRDADQLRGPR
jgi:hypothetical protein